MSGMGAFGFYKLSKMLQHKKKLLALFGYAGFVIGIFFVMPNNPDEITAPMSLVNEFRITSVLAVSIYWISLGTIVGIMWRTFNPDKKIKESLQ